MCSINGDAQASPFLLAGDIHSGDFMSVIFLIGGIASGKSRVAEMLAAHGLTRIDLDQISRDVLAPGTRLVTDISKHFGSDLVDEHGVLDRARLAERAFASPTATEQLEALELPAIKEELVRRLTVLHASDQAVPQVVVEVPLPDRMGPLLDLADEVVCVFCPYALRRARALGRGMTEEDFTRRAARQLSDTALVDLADTIIDNSGDEQALREYVEAWYRARTASSTSTHE